MKKMVLIRRTPLRPRRQYRPPVRAESDKVSPELHTYILRRDRYCIAYIVDPAHQCRDRWGTNHAPDNAAKLTLDHVKDNARMGDRAESDRSHLVAACGWANNEGWCSAHRTEERDYLARVEP